ncbi:hypothetical protein LJC15_04455 [Desulfovibrio sp. OttesenSCG-928-G11]|nr:hypothetical protein [Desulfovibrio sp. OttesenSCG-928-G11]
MKNRQRTVKVIGIGGGGCNGINTLIDLNLQGASLIAANMDKQSLNDSRAEHKLLLGAKAFRGRGAEGDPFIGYEAAMESLDLIKKTLSGADMVFIMAGLGGGTGTGAAPVIAEAANDLGCFTVGMVTTPFSFEGKKRWQNAETGIKELCKHVGQLIIISNGRLLEAAPQDVVFTEMTKKPYEHFYRAIRDIACRTISCATSNIWIINHLN